MIYLDLFLTFLKIGLFTFGGGYAMLPMIQEEVALNGWLDQSELIDFIAVSESTPGPFAVNIATFVGTRTGGIFGGLCATLGVVLPSFVIILIVARCYQKFKSNKLVTGAMNGLKPAVVGLIAAALLSLSQTVFFPQGLSAAAFGTAQFYVSLGIFAVAVVLAFKKLHPILIILLSAVIGIIAGVIGTA
ncbi:MAG: chromate transporter [Ruminococcus sp.]|nr:chromate transporter [Ruminococcus sp.]